MEEVSEEYRYQCSLIPHEFKWDPVKCSFKPHFTLSKPLRIRIYLHHGKKWLVMVSQHCWHSNRRSFKCSLSTWIQESSDAFKICLKILLVRNLEKAAISFCGTAGEAVELRGVGGGIDCAIFATDLKFGKTVWTFFCAWNNISYFFYVDVSRKWLTKYLARFPF